MKTVFVYISIEYRAILHTKMSWCGYQWILAPNASDANLDCAFVVSLVKLLKKGRFNETPSRSYDITLMEHFLQWTQH